MSKVFLDTNVLAYAADKHSKKKQKHCRDLIRSFETHKIRPVISTQVLQEFFIVATRKLHIDPLAAKEMIHSFRNFEVITVTPEIIEAGIDCSILNRISFWDGLIIGAAESSKCSTLITEDLNHGQVIRGIQIQNPFEFK